MRQVAGYCPMGCGETLFLGTGAHITCSWHECPRPQAADEILAGGETDHLVTIRKDGFTVEHPLRERLDGALHHCPLHRDLACADGPPAKPGRYRVIRHEADATQATYRPGPLGAWDFEEVS